MAIDQRPPNNTNALHYATARTSLSIEEITQTFFAAKAHHEASVANILAVARDVDRARENLDLIMTAVEVCGTPTPASTRRRLARALLQIAGMCVRLARLQHSANSWYIEDLGVLACCLVHWTGTVPDDLRLILADELRLLAEDMDAADWEGMAEDMLGLVEAHDQLELCED